MPYNKQQEKAGFLKYVFDFYKSMRSHEIKLVYEGKVTHQITKAFVSLAEAQMEENEEAVRIQRVVLHVLVEFLQNISKHADDYESGNYFYSGKGIFMVSNTEGHLSDKGGAGLGLIDVRRKTKKKIEYHTTPLSKNLSFFLLSASINKINK